MIQQKRGRIDDSWHGMRPLRITIADTSPIIQGKGVDGWPHPHRRCGLLALSASPTSLERHGTSRQSANNKVGGIHRHD